MFEKEDSVTIESGTGKMLIGALAVVEDYSPSTNLVDIRIVKDANGIRENQQVITIHPRHLKKNEAVKDIYNLIDYALDTKDKEWFLQLTSSFKNKEMTK
ncbi:IDEAL domain-containing protein [Priestia megaterium]|uniref:IDEAL domain-containing protein n=1 Tax=Priestia megaterium TaxID=1404 RepID=UPI002E20127D|nr:IDEAL domain-containing protein [Priestia megaterium]